MQVDQEFALCGVVPEEPEQATAKSGEDRLGWRVQAALNFDSVLSGELVISSKGVLDVRVLIGLSHRRVRIATVTAW
jgi:hypothetical protein